MGCACVLNILLQTALLTRVSSVEIRMFKTQTQGWMVTKFRACEFCISNEADV